MTDVVRGRKAKKQYAPKLREDQIQNLYRLRMLRKRPMTKILRQIVDEYFEAHKDELEGLVVIHKT